MLQIIHAVKISVDDYNPNDFSNFWIWFKKIQVIYKNNQNMCRISASQRDQGKDTNNTPNLFWIVLRIAFSVFKFSRVDNLKNLHYPGKSTSYGYSSIIPRQLP
jgi:hypothetical protein